MAIRVGISGWRYEPWRGVFYPDDLRQRDELAFASKLFNSIELNGSFYSLQRPEYYTRWRDETPDGFVFAVKGPRYITHLKRLRDIEGPMANFFASGVLALEAKLGPILWQFPPNFRYDTHTFDTFFEMLPTTREDAIEIALRHTGVVEGRAYLASKTTGALRHAIEIRHESFRNDEFLQSLRDRNFALVVADTAGKWPLMEEQTADFSYVRLHGDEVLYTSGYGDKALEMWAKKIRAWTSHDRDAYVYFDNDIKAHAPFDAMELAKKLGVKWSLTPMPMKRAKVKRRPAPRRKRFIF